MSRPMIFVTIGSMFPFDRLVRAMDDWAGAGGAAEGEIFAQIGAGGYEPRHMRWARELGFDDYNAAVAGAGVVVAHAGMGSVITAGDKGKPIVLLPRRAAFGEHTNDHQLDTAGWLRTRPGIYVADTERDLATRLSDALAGGVGAGALDTAAPAGFLSRLRAFALES
ncbi:glycosyltransferase [uncultured Amaricoccus sp.]|uniref:glycosyltransferase n=1 Tax=uncultured Amaricoccus sp. TaxID=339341 RepID=UPI00260194D2|nr:glycosyltransferase [uncultured Amaricoccus sp.]